MVAVAWDRERRTVFEVGRNTRPHRAAPLPAWETETTTNFEKLAHHFDPDQPAVSNQPLCVTQMFDIMSAQNQLGLTDEDLDEAVRRLTRGRLSGQDDLGGVDADLRLSRLKAAGAV